MTLIAQEYVNVRSYRICLVVFLYVFNIKFGKKNPNPKNKTKQKSYDSAH